MTNETHQSTEPSVASSIAILGGMFDPVHNGHLSSALSALQTFGFDQVRLVPCGSPVHRQGAHVSDEHRLKMLGLAVEQESKLLVDDRECQTQAPSYTLSSLQSIKAENPHAKLFLLMGVDAFNTLTTWYNWQQIFDYAHIIVITRPGWSEDLNDELEHFIADRRANEFSDLQQTQTGKVLFHSFTPMMIGSTQVRELIKKNQSARFLLPDSVWDYIKHYNLYH